jgi:dephospho-CoA kinase
MPPVLLCLTGPIAAGKNAAAAILEKKGFAIIDADMVVHHIIEDKQGEIAAAFGTADRKALGALLFRHPELLKKQEDILYPAVLAELEAFIASHRDEPVALNVTLLYKVSLIKKVDAVLFVDAPRIIRFFRLKKRNRLKAPEIFARFKAQTKIFSHYSAASADIYRVWNVGSLATLEKNIDRFLKEWEAKGYGKWNTNKLYGSSQQ